MLIWQKLKIIWRHGNNTFIYIYINSTTNPKYSRVFFDDKPKYNVLNQNASNFQSSCIIYLPIIFLSKVNVNLMGLIKVMKMESFESKRSKPLVRGRNLTVLRHPRGRCYMYM